jgi:hypothetical protein
MKVISIKPHHLLDIIKLYGAGLNHFVPDPSHQHDFYRVGNIALKNPNTIVMFTIGNDAICTPCKFNQNHYCMDVVANNPSKFQSKDVWNKTIDKRLMKILGINENDQMTIHEYCQLAFTRLNPGNIKEIWKERPDKETANRTALLLKGLKKYLSLDTSI